MRELTRFNEERDAVLLGQVGHRLRSLVVAVVAGRFERRVQRAARIQRVPTW